MSASADTGWWQSLERLFLPETSLWYNLEVSATRYPSRPAIIFYDNVLSYAELEREAELLAGFLQRQCGVRRGDRVALQLHNSPQFIVAFYAIVRADAMVVPVSSMNRTAELAHIVADSGSKVLITSQDLFPQSEPLLGKHLEQVIVACYSDYFTAPTDLAVPDFIKAPRLEMKRPGVIPWTDALNAGLQPGPSLATPDDLCVMPYTSGTTGQPKGCIHKHRSVMHTTVALAKWHSKNHGSCVLAILPFFHVTGMQSSMNAPIYMGAAVVTLPRWDRDIAAKLIQRHQVTGLTAVPTVIVDLLTSPRLAEYDLSSLRKIGGGGAAMPEAIARQLESMCRLTYIEGYGLSETMAVTHINPSDCPKPQCLGVPIYETETLIIDPHTLQEVPQGEVGEIISRGPQVFEGYWNNPEATAECFITVGGKRFFRTGDLGRIDADGYFFFVDRLKRMINAAGFKVWPAEVEALLYAHPAIQEVAIIGKPDPRRGETVKAVAVLHPHARDKVTAQELTDWARQNMASYKVPREWEFVDSLPKSASGKIQWRVLQDRERAGR
ncbi:MAG TPA: long-chain fatty acid--CoA ligase [Steroidobacteraceae bacterium]